MRDGSPRLWPYAPANSPLPLPDRALFTSSQDVTTLTADFEDLNLDAILSGSELAEHFAQFFIGQTPLNDHLKAQEVDLLSKRHPILLLGELANPYCLQDINVGPLPIFPCRIQDVCRTWADGLDSRSAYPGVHHITLARTPGWWESAHIGMATIEQMKAMMAWLDNGIKGVWKAVKLDEGIVRLEHGPNLDPPSKEDVTWDGSVERVERASPPGTGPFVDLSMIRVPIHTRHGCYNNRGRLARCAHLNQRNFHDNLFRKGSSHRWDDVLSTK